MHQSIVAAAFFAVASCCAYGAQTEPEPRLTFGVVSDIHFSKPGDENYFVRALEYFRDHGADGVLCAGDLTESATVEQLERVANTRRRQSSPKTTSRFRWRLTVFSRTT